MRPERWFCDRSSFCSAPNASGSPQLPGNFPSSKQPFRKMLLVLAVPGPLQSLGSVPLKRLKERSRVCKLPGGCPRPGGSAPVSSLLVSDKTSSDTNPWKTTYALTLAYLYP